jgi:hypothetical protein
MPPPAARFECSICLTEAPQRQRVSCTRCVNGLCVRCFRTIATTAAKTDVECPYCKMVFTTCHVESLLTRSQITARRVNVRVKHEYDYIQVTYERINDMTNLCGLMDSLRNLHIQLAHARMQRFPLTYLRPCDAPASRAELGRSNRLADDIAQLQLRMTCVSNHIGRLVSSGQLPETLVADCVSNVFEPCSETTDLDTYATAPDLQELLTIGLLLCNPHVVRPNVFQYGMMRIIHMRALHSMETWVRKLTVQCKASLTVAEWYAALSAAMRRDRAHGNAPPQAEVLSVLDTLARNGKASTDWRAWFALVRRWRAHAVPGPGPVPSHA